MMVLWDGTPSRPGGRQLYAEEWPLQPPPERIGSARGFVANPRPIKPVVEDHRSERSIAREKRLAIIRRAVRERPHTAAELAPLVGQTVDQVNRLLYQLSYQRMVRVVGQQTIQDAGFSRTTRTVRLYGPMESRPL